MNTAIKSLMFIMCLWVCQVMAGERNENESWTQLETISLGTVQSDSRTLDGWVDFLEAVCRANSRRGGYQLVWRVKKADPVFIEKKQIVEWNDWGQAPREEDKPVEPLLRGNTVLDVYLPDCSLYELIDRMAPILGIHFEFYNNKLWVTTDGFSGPLRTKRFRVRDIFWENLLEAEYIRDKRRFKQVKEISKKVLEQKVVAFFERMGIGFPEGTWLKANHKNGVLAVHHTEDDLRNIEMLLRLTYSVPYEWIVEAEYDTPEQHQTETPTPGFDQTSDHGGPGKGESDESGFVLQETASSDAPPAMPWSGKTEVDVTDFAPRHLKDNFDNQLIITPSRKESIPSRLYFDLYFERGYGFKTALTLDYQSPAVSIPLFSSGWDDPEDKQKKLRLKPRLRRQNDNTPYFSGNERFSAMVKTWTPSREFRCNPIFPEFKVDNISVKEAYRRIENEGRRLVENKEDAPVFSWILFTSDVPEFTLTCHRINLKDLIKYCCQAAGVRYQAEKGKVFVTSRKIPTSKKHIQWLYLDARAIDVIGVPADMKPEFWGWDGISARKSTTPLHAYVKRIIQDKFDDAQFFACRFGDAVVVAYSALPEQHKEFAKFFEEAIQKQEKVVRLKVMPARIIDEDIGPQVSSAFEKIQRTAIRDVWDLPKAKKLSLGNPVNLTSLPGGHASYDFDDYCFLKTRHYSYFPSEPTDFKLVQMEHLGDPFSGGKYIESALSGTIQKSPGQPDRQTEQAEWRIKSFFEIGENYVMQIPASACKDDRGREILSFLQGRNIYWLLRAELVKIGAPKIRHAISY
ncbi:MAG: hypothetical protein R6V56_00650 [Lentisphaeria bacterium]